MTHSFIYYSHADYQATGCEDGEVRLTHRGNTKATGRIQLCLNNTWGTVCSDSIADHFASGSVVCRQLGFGGEGRCLPVQSASPCTIYVDIHIFARIQYCVPCAFLSFLVVC